MGRLAQGLGNQLIRFLIGIMTFTVLWVLVLPRQQSFAKSFQLTNALIVTFFAVYFVNILLHETGHMVLGFLSGHRLQSFRVWWFTLERHGDRYRFRLRPGGGAAGAVGMTPIGFDNLTERSIVLTAGGPLASILTGITALGAYLLGGALFTLPEVVTYVLWLWAVLAIMDAVTNLIPFRVGSYFTDGKHILTMLLGGPRARYLTGVRILSTYMETTRPRDWPPEAIAMVTGLRDGSIDALHGSMLAYQHKEDARDFEGAWAELKRQLTMAKNFPYKQIYVIYMEAAYFVAVRLGDAKTARLLYKKVRSKKKLPEASRLTVEAAIHYALGQYPQAQAKAERALMLHLQNKKPPVPEAVMQSVLETVEELIVMARDAQQSQTAAQQSPTIQPIRPAMDYTKRGEPRYT